MEIHSQLVLAPDALEGTRAPALWTCVGVLALVALVSGIQAWRAAPADWTDLPSFEVAPLGAVELYKQRSGRFATEPVSHGEALVLLRDDSTPAALASALIPIDGVQWALRIHGDLELGPARLRALNRAGARWTVSLVDKQVVRIASPNGELLRYREFRSASQHERWHLAAVASISGLCAALLACYSRRLLEALARRARRFQAQPPMKSP